MNYFYVLNGRKLKQYFLLFIAVVFAVGVVFIEKDNISVFSQQKPGAIYSVETETPSIALTFDLSWGDQQIEPILEVLSEKEIAKATFFLSSPWIKAHPELAKKIVDAGYEIGSHGHKHVNYTTLEDEEIRKQIQTAHHTLQEITGKSPRFIRLPNGDFDQRVLNVVNNLNYTVIQWGTDAEDWKKDQQADSIANRVLSSAYPGDIVLMHASDSATQTHLALPIIIEGLQSKGYEFRTVSELISQTKLQGNSVEN